MTPVTLLISMFDYMEKKEQEFSTLRSLSKQLPYPSSCRHLTHVSITSLPVVQRRCYQERS
jgi:hypothetical protein